MNKYTFCKDLYLKLLLGCCWIGLFSHEVLMASDSQNDRPNVVFILVDDLGYGQLGCTGNPIIKTPRIDQFAQEGIFFTDAYTGGTVCSPSRISLLTGRDARLLHSPANTILLRPTDKTLAHVLSANGYQTAIFGKFGIGNTFGVNGPMAMGFTRWRGLLHNIQSHRQYPITIYDDNTVEFVRENVGGAEGKDAQRIFTDGGLDFLDQQNGEQPFFMFMSYTSPHAELAAPEEFVAPYREQYEARSYPGWTGDENAPGYPAYYPKPVENPDAVVAGMISALDTYIGEILDKLDEKGLSENTIVFFATDNGPHSEGGAAPDATMAPGPFRGGKRDLYDGGIRTPFFVRWPNHIDPGCTNGTPVAFADVLPTLMELCDAPAENMDGLAYNGVSIADLLVGKQSDLPERYLYWAFGKQVGDPNSGIVGNVAQAVRKGKWKAVRLNQQSSVELYDILSDPKEKMDISKKNPQIVREIEDFFGDNL